MARRFTADVSAPPAIALRWSHTRRGRWSGFVEQHPALYRDDESLASVPPRLLCSALSEGQDPLEPEREGGCLHVSRIGTCGLDLKSASGLFGSRPP